MADLVVLLVVIAAAVALAPYLGWFVVVALIVGMVAVAIGHLAQAEQRFAAWYDTTRLARWIAGPPSVTLSVTRTDPTRETEGVPEPPCAERGRGERIG